MAEDVEIEYGRRRIVSVNFVKNPNNLHAVRTASGFELQVPIVVTLLVRTSDKPMVMLSNLHGRVLTSAADGSWISVGRLEDESWRTAGFASGESYPHRIETYLKWIGTFADMAYVEKLRDGGVPKLQMDLRGEFCFLLKAIEDVPEERWNQLSEIEQSRVEEYASFRICTQPQQVHSRLGYIEVSYSREAWVSMIRKLRVSENVLVEVPLPPSPSDPWNGVWKALVDARNAFEQGGTTGWQATVTSVRLGLERWHDIEPEDQGAGWVSPSRTDRESRTKKQRLDALRWHLKQAAHLGPHTGAEEWSRKDALLMLSTLSALLAEREP